MFNALTAWLGGVVANFRTLSPTEQITWVIGTIGAVLGGGIWVWERLRRKDKHATNPQTPTEGATHPALVPTSTRLPDISPRWEYQWEIGDSVLPRSVEPSLSSSIIEEIQGAAAGGRTSFLILVRGELGIGKTTLAATLPQELKKAAMAIATEHREVANFIETCIVSEADDLQPAEDFARQINAFIEAGGAVVALARPVTLEVVERRLGRSPDAIVTMLPFEPTRPLFHECISAVAKKFQLQDDEAKKKLHAFASRFDQRFLQTPFYFEQVALAIAADPNVKADGSVTPLQIFQRAIEKRLSESGVRFSDLVESAAASSTEVQGINVPGIVTEGGFTHDGYRNVVLAAAFVTGAVNFIDIVKCENAIPAINIILSHLRLSRRPYGLLRRTGFEKELRKFVLSPPEVEDKHYPVYVQGLVADTFRKLRDDVPAEELRKRCMQLIRGRPLVVSGSGIDTSIWWDVSDALSEVDDPRLRKARREKYSRTSGYFTEVASSEIEIGSMHIPTRTDLAKPLLPYKRQKVRVGPFWVANFLVTNELFLEFWDDPNRDRHFRATGAQWLSKNPELMREIELAFDTSAKRCFWKELSEQEAILISGVHSVARSPLDLARKKALRAEEQVSLWDPVQADERFSARGKPVVGVNWWEAMAFCHWWTEHRIPLANFPPGSIANLMTDWEWEAIRRIYYEPSDLLDQDKYPSNRYPAHTRTSQQSVPGGRVGNAMRSLHVGLSLPRNGAGPTDFVGNVWEWTRSRAFGRIVESDSATGEFGQTLWLDLDNDAEQTPKHPDRDVTDELNDLSYRTTRGGSFFSRDAQAAWHPAYRLCDPPFNSFIDLGFRFAVYPPSNGPIDNQ